MEKEYTRYTIEDVKQALSMRGLKYKNYQHGIVCQCPMHNGRDFNCQMTEKDDGTGVNAYCYSHCGSFFADEAMEELRRDDKVPNANELEEFKKLNLRRENEQEQEVSIKSEIPELQELWKKSLPLPPERIFPEMPNEYLAEYGWRWIDNDTTFGMGRGVLIPYWTSEYPEKKVLGFAQVRHLSGLPRFHFAKKVCPTVYGKWELKGQLLRKPAERHIYIVEGTHEAILFHSMGFPAVALPSASSGTLLANLAKWCRANSIALVYAGDKDKAGDKLRQVLENERCSYRTYQAPDNYKDYGDYAKDRGMEEAYDYIAKFDANFCDTKVCSDQGSTGVCRSDKEPVQQVLDIFGGKVLTNFGGSDIFVGKN